MKEYLREIKMLVASEYGLVVEFGTVITPTINALAQYLTRLLNSKPITGVIEVIPTYCSVMIHFDPLCITRCLLSQLIREMLNNIKLQDLQRLSPRSIQIPVCYGGVVGPDLEFVARQTGLSVTEFIKIHTAKPYLVYMLGFTPGFPYLGGMSERIAVPRRGKPRTKIPAGSVGIGGNQTGFYPIESPGAWWLIGRTPVKAFNGKSNQPFLFAAGDYLHFVQITIDEYFSIRRDVEAGTYIPQISSL